MTWEQTCSEARRDAAREQAGGTAALVQTPDGENGFGIRLAVVWTLEAGVN